MAKKHTGTAAPLGLFCFGITTTLMMLYTMYPKPSGIMLPLAYVFGGIMMIICAIIEIYRQDVFHGTTFGSYGAFYVAAANGCGSVIYYCAWGILTFGFFIISMRHNIGSMMLFGSLTLAFMLLGAGIKGSPLPTWDIVFAGCWTVFCTGCIAIYAAFGTLIHEAYKILLPGMAPMPAWFPLCCFWKGVRKPKVRSIWGLRFTPSEQAYYTGSPAGSASGFSTPVAGAADATAAAPAAPAGAATGAPAAAAV